MAAEETPRKPPQGSSEQNVGIALLAAVAGLKTAHYALCRASDELAHEPPEGFDMTSDLVVRTKDESESVLDELESLITTWPALAAQWLQVDVRRIE